MINPDFLSFSKAQIITGDVDPVYPYLKHLIKTKGYNLKFILDYMSSYNLGAVMYYYNTGKILTTASGSADTGVERRGFRGLDTMAKALSGNEDNAKYLESTLTLLKTYSDGVYYISKIEGYGRWASFKLTEILDYCYDLNLDCDNLFTEQGSGHAEGLKMLTGASTATETLARNTYLEYKEVYPEYRYQNFETNLCDWKNLCRGKYYVGNDIDMLRQQLKHAGVYDEAEFGSIFNLYDFRAENDRKTTLRTYLEQGKPVWYE